MSKSWCIAAANIDGFASGHCIGVVMGLSHLVAASSGGIARRRASVQITTAAFSSCAGSIVAQRTWSLARRTT